MRLSRSMRLSRDHVGPSMRLSRGRLAREHASIPGSVGLSMRLSRSRVGLSMRLSRSRPEHDPTRACVYPGVGWPGVGWPKHASIPGSVGLSMRLFRGRLTRACVNSGVGRPKHASIPGSVGLSMRWMKSDMRSASLRLAVPTGGPAFGCLRPASVSGGGSFARCAGDAGLKTGVPGRCRATVPV